MDGIREDTAGDAGERIDERERSERRSGIGLSISNEIKYKINPKLSLVDEVSLKQMQFMCSFRLIQNQHRGDWSH